MADTSAFVVLTRIELFLTDQQIKMIYRPVSDVTSLNKIEYPNITIKILHIVSIPKEEWTKMKVEQLASTLASSAVTIAFAVTDRPGHP